MELAVDAYISRVSQAPCGNSYSFVQRCEEQHSGDEQREPACFLKGIKKDKEALKRNNPALLEYFQNIWSVRCRYMVKGLPS